MVSNRTSSEIRRMLHPQYNREFLPKNEGIWIPGNYSSNKELLAEKKVVTLKEENKKLYSCYDKFEDIDANEGKLIFF